MVLDAPGKENQPVQDEARVSTGGNKLRVTLEDVSPQQVQSMKSNRRRNRRRNTVTRQRTQSTGSNVLERVVVIKRTDMPDDMQKEAIILAIDALKRFTVEKNVATFMKKEFDAKYGHTWHCIVGRSFGSYVTHESKSFTFFYVDQDGVMLYKTK